MVIIATVIESNLLIGDTNGDDDDEFSMEEGGSCCFTKSLPVNYLRMWLVEKLHMTSSIIHKIARLTLQMTTTKKESFCYNFSRDKFKGKAEIFFRIYSRGFHLCCAAEA
jgi:hypothetical protein